MNNGKNKMKVKEGFDKAGEFVLTHYPGKIHQVDAVYNSAKHQEELYTLRKGRSLL